MIEMRGGSLVIIALILIYSTSVSAKGFDYQMVQSSNEYGTYVYFSTFLNESHSVLSIVLNGQNSSIGRAQALYLLANTTYDTLVMYSSFGVNEKSVRTASYAVLLAEGVYLVATGDNAFRAAFSKGDFKNSKNALLRMRVGLDKISSALRLLHSVKLKGRNGTELYFSLNPLEKDIINIKILIDQYNKSLKRLKRPKDFTIFSSKQSLMVEENVTIYGFASKLKDVSLIINGKAFPVNLSNGSFSLVYSFSEPGTYIIYGIAINGSVNVVSNRLRLNVTRIPTKIIATENVSQKPMVIGYLIDYFGRPVPGENIALFLGKTRISTTTDSNGAFIISLPSLTGNVTTLLYFSGSKIYLNTTLPIHLTLPGRRPIIKIFVLNKHSTGPVRIGGEIQENYTLPLRIYVDNNLNMTIRTHKKFVFSIRLPPGKHTIYAYFPGDKTLAPSKSNVLTIDIKGPNYLTRLILFFSIVAFLVSYYVISKKKTLSKFDNRITSHPAIVGEPAQKRIDFRTSYKITYKFLKRLKNLPPSTTPRELLNHFQWTPAKRYLKDLTEIHENVVYAQKKFPHDMLKDAIKKASHAIIAAIVGDEL